MAALGINLGFLIVQILNFAIVAIVLTALVRLALLRLRVKAALPLLVYPSLASLFTFLLWLIFFY